MIFLRIKGTRAEAEALLVQHGLDAQARIQENEACSHCGGPWTNCTAWVNDDQLLKVIDWDLNDVSKDLLQYQKTLD